MNLLPSANSGCCLTECEESTGIQVPGPPGPPATNGNDGADGVSAFTLTTASFVMPAEGANVTVNVVNSAAAVLGQILFVQNAGEMLVASIPGATSLSLRNLENTATAAYTTNAAPGTVIASGSKVGPGGRQGPTGSAAGALLSANNLVDVASPATSRTNLGLGTMATQAASGVSITGGAVGVMTDVAVAATIRTNIGAQPLDTDLTAIAALVSAANKMPYATGAGTWALADLTATARSFLSQGTTAALQQALEVLPSYGLLGSLAADFNSTADQAIAIHPGVSSYVIRRIVVAAASINMTTAVGGFYAAPAKTTPLVAATQVYTALTTGTKFVDATLTTLCGTDFFSVTPIYLSLTTPQGAPATAAVFVFGERLS